MPTINKTTLTATIGIAGFAGLVFGCIGGGIGGYQIRKGQETAPVASTATAAPQAPTGPANSPRPTGRPTGPMSRKAFEAAVTGKTQDQIIAAVGRPDDTRERVPGGSYNAGAGMKLTFTFDWWVYHNRVINDATGKPYPTVAVRFAMDGKADRFEYP